MPGTNEAFSRVKIDAQLKDQGWDVLNPNAVRFEYRVLSGWACPAQGGPASKQLTYEQKAIDRLARLAISQELGHGRERIASVYLGR